MRFANRPRLRAVGIVGGDRLPVFFLKGVGHGVATSLVPRLRVSDPLPPMPSVREWLESYGGTRMDGSTFDRCEADWYALLERRRRQTSAYLAGMFTGTCIYALGVLALVALACWLAYRLVPYDGVDKLTTLIRR